MISSLGTSFVWSITKDVKISVIRDAFQVVEYQQKFWNKGFPYGIGIFTGLFVWKVHHEENEGTFFQKVVERIEESAIIRYLMHFSGIILILSVIFALHPIDHDRDHDIDAVSAVLLTASQVFMPIGLALNFIPMVLNRSVNLKAFMGSPLFKPHAALLVLMVPLSGSISMYIMYDVQDGIYFDFKTYLYYAISLWIILAFIALILYVFIIFPSFNTINSLFDQFGRDITPGMEGIAFGDSIKHIEITEEDEEEEESRSVSPKSRSKDFTDE